MIRFIDEHKDDRSGTLRWGIESIAKTLGIAPSTYHAAKKRPPSARALRDAELRPQILRVWEENLAVYGADKIWDQLNKDEISVARCTVERLMRDLGLQGCRRGRGLDPHHGGRRCVGSAGGSGRPQVHCVGTEPAVGGGPHLRQDALGVGLRRVHRRRVLADGRGLASQPITQIGSGDRRCSRWPCSTANVRARTCRR